VNVSAKDLGTGREQKITITASSGLSKDEVDKMMREAESHADEDRRQRERIEAKNKLDSFVYQTEKSLGEYRDRLDSATASEIDRAIEDAKQKLQNEQTTASDLNEAYETLSKASHKLAEVIYKQAGDQGGDQAGGAAGSAEATGNSGRSAAEDDVIDAEYVDVDEER
jgi:molecular chaperone DnaK